MEWWVASLFVCSETLKAQQTWEGPAALWGDCSIEVPQATTISCEILFIFPLHSCVNQEDFWEAPRFSVIAAKLLSGLSSQEEGNFMANVHTGWQGMMRADRPKYICKFSLGHLCFTILYQVNGNQGTTFPESSPPLILNNQIKMGSLYSGAAPASRSPGNKAPYRLPLDLKA